MYGTIEQEFDRYAIRLLPGNTACIFNRENPDEPARFCGSMAHAKEVMEIRRADVVNAAKKAERERCAKIAEYIWDHHGGGHDIASAIRALT